MESRQTVAIVIPAAEAAKTLPKTLASIGEQTYPAIEEIVVASADEATATAAKRPGVTVVHNPSGRTATGLNLAIAETTSDVIVRVDAHSTIPPDYVAIAVRLLDETSAEMVGGMQIPVGASFWERSIAAAMRSPFGAGDARHRIGGEAGPSDTVYLGIFPRQTFDALGGFDESFVRHQDYEFNRRIIESGGTVWFDSHLRTKYRPRSSLRLLASQYFQYGTWKRRFSQIHRGAMRLRQFIPPLLVLTLIASLLASLVWPASLLIVVGYVVVLAAIGLAQVPRVGSAAIGMPPALAIMHISWGVGFLFGQTSDR